MNQQDLVNTYSKFTIEQLLEAYHNPNDYTNEAKEALAIVIKNRGGIENLLANERLKNEFLVESERIKQEVRRLQTPGVDLEFLTKMIKSDIFEVTQKEGIIKQTFDEVTREWEDRKIKPRTILGGGLAAGLASLIGGVLWGLQMMWSGRVFAIFLIGLILLCYALIRLFTKQSHKNTAVFVLTLISVIVALIVGQLIFEIFGIR